MKVHKTFRYRIYPSKEQICSFNGWDRALRWLWNLALEQRLIGLSRTKLERKYYTNFDQIAELSDLRKEAPWLAEVPAHVCHQVLYSLDDAWKRCFNKIAGRPHFKKQGIDYLSFKVLDGKRFRIDDGQLIFPKIGNIEVVQDRPLEGEQISATITKDVDQWFVCIVCEVEIDTPRNNGPIVAIDRGVINLIADSNGNIVENPRFLKQGAAKLARAQKQAARCKRGSNNHKKKLERVAKIHRKIRRQRDHVLHEISNQYTKSHSVIVWEKLQIENMTRSAHGTAENPGSNIAQKSGLNRSILDAGWGRLFEFSTYKGVWNGCRNIEGCPAFSSQQCEICDNIDKANRLSQSKFKCTGCGHTAHADTNAAKVMLKRFYTAGEPPAVLPVKALKSHRSRNPGTVRPGKGKGA